MHVWSDSVSAAIWSRLRYLSSPANVRGLLSGTVQSKRTVVQPTGTQCDQVAAAVRQADEYFFAAQQVSMATKPLLLYYGSLCLAARG